MNHQHWTMDIFDMDNGQWTKWTMDNGQWTMNI
jgi:hypothetical protein